MAIFRGIGGSGDSSDNSYLQEVTAQANAASASASASSASASSASTSASNASNSASDAESAKTVAESSASTAVAQAIVAAGQAGIATSQAGIATTKASEAAASATAAQNLEITSASFDTADGTLTLTKANSGTVTTDLDGRYLTTHQNISGKANLSGATFTGAVNIGTFGNGFDLGVYGTTTLYSGLNVVGNITATGTVDGVDIATRDGVLTSTTTTADNALPKAGGQMTGNITFSGTQTVDGRDISVDGSRLDTIPFNRVTHKKLRGTASLTLTTTPQSVSQYENTIHPSTPVKCSRYVDLSMVVQWRYINSNTNDLQLQFQVVVPSGSPTVTNLGTITKGPFTDYTVGTYEQWFYVSGDYTHLFTDFGRLNKTGTSGATEFTVRSFQYDPSTNRTYVLTEDNPGAFVSSGDTVYWHPYAWESAGSFLTEYVDIDERYVSYGNQTINIKFKTAYDDSTLTYKIKAKEMSSTDSGLIYKATARLIDVEEV